MAKRNSKGQFVKKSKKSHRRPRSLKAGPSHRMLGSGSSPSQAIVLYRPPAKYEVVGVKHRKPRSKKRKAAKPLPRYTISKKPGSRWRRSSPKRRSPSRRRKARRGERICVDAKRTRKGRFTSRAAPRSSRRRRYGKRRHRVSAHRRAGVRVSSYLRNPISGGEIGMLVGVTAVGYLLTDVLSRYLQSEPSGFATTGTDVAVPNAASVLGFPSWWNIGAQAGLSLVGFVAGAECSKGGRGGLGSAALYGVGLGAGVHLVSQLFTAAMARWAGSKTSSQGTTPNGTLARLYSGEIAAQNSQYTVQAQAQAATPPGNARPGFAGPPDAHGLLGRAPVGLGGLNWSPVSVDEVQRVMPQLVQWVNGTVQFAQSSNQPTATSLTMWFSGGWYYAACVQNGVQSGIAPPILYFKSSPSQNFGTNGVAAPCATVRLPVSAAAQAAAAAQGAAASSAAGSVAAAAAAQAAAQAYAQNVQQNNATLFASQTFRRNTIQGLPGSLGMSLDDVFPD